MTAKKPKIASLEPQVWEDNRRVTLAMEVENLPTLFANVAFTMPDDFDAPPVRPPKPDVNAPSPYPNIELSILNSQRQQIVSLFIVEHKEAFTSLTMHIPEPNPQEQYTARAEMTYQEELLDVVESPFILHQVN